MSTNDDFYPNSRMSRTTGRAAAAARSSLDAASSGAERAIDAASSKLDDLADSAAPVLRQGIDQARGWVEDQAGHLQDRVQAARDTASDLTDRAVRYARDEPVKAALIGVAVGALLVTVMALIVRSDD